MASVSVQLGLLAVAKDPASPDLSGVTAATERITGAGHKVVALHTAADAEDEIRDQLTHWINDPEIDVVIVLGGADSNAASAALKPLITEVIPGFTDLFRWMMFQEKGASAMLSSAEAARCTSTFVFVLPGAVAAAMEKLILPQFDPSTTPRNLLGDVPRLRDAVPNEVVVEKTQGGSGLQHRLPARPRSRTGANVIARHPVDDPPTKPIDLERLQREIALASGKGEDITKPHVLAAMLPRVPPGADSNAAETLDPDDDFTATDLLPAPAPTPQAAAKPPGAKPLPSIVRPTATTTGTAAPPAKTSAAASLPIPAPVTIAPKRSAAATAPPAGASASTPRTPGSKSTPPRSQPTEQLPFVPRPPADRAPVAERIASPSTGPRNQPTEQLPFVPRPPADRAPVAERIASTDAGSARNQPTEQYPTVGRKPAIPAGARAPSIPPPATPTTDALLAERDAAIERAARAAEEQRLAEAERATTTDDDDGPITDADELEEAAVITDVAPGERAARDSGAGDLAARARAVVGAGRRATDAASVRDSALTIPRPRIEEDELADPAPSSAGTPRAAADARDSARTAPRTRPPTAPPPARVRPPTQPPPPPARATGAALEERPKNLFAEPRKKKTSTLVLQILACVAVVVVGFGAVVYLFDTTDRNQPAAPTQVAVAPPPVPADAAVAIAPSPDAAAEPDIEMDPVPPTPRTPTPRTPTPKTPVVKAPTPTPTPKTPAPKPPVETPAVPVDAAVATTPPADDDCDETACVLSKYDRPCCAKYKPAATDFQPRVGGLPEALDKPMVRAGVSTIKARVVTCGDKNPGAGTVKIAVTVSPDGAVTDASVVDAPSPALGECVAGAMKSAKFGKSVTGGTFTYPFVFGGS